MIEGKVNLASELKNSGILNLFETIVANDDITGCVKLIEKLSKDGVCVLI